MFDADAWLKSGGGLRIAEEEPREAKIIRSSKFAQIAEDDFTDEENQMNKSDRSVLNAATQRPDSLGGRLFSAAIALIVLGVVVATAARFVYWMWT